MGNIAQKNLSWLILIENKKEVVVKYKKIKKLRWDTSMFNNEQGK